MTDNAGSTHFGFRTVPTEAKKGLVREVFESVAPRYDLMNDLMSFGIHRVWKRIFVTTLGPRPSMRLLDLAGGTGDITFAALDRGCGHAVLSDINPAMLRVAEQSGVRYVHIIRPRVSGDEDRTASQADTDVVATARRLFSRTVIAAGGFSPDSAEAELVSGRADLIAFGRPFIGNPDFVKRLRQNVPLSAFDSATLYTIGPRGYTDYPTAT